MISFFVGLITGGCVAALAIVLCEASDDGKSYPTGDKCCYFCSGASECVHACKSNPNKCGKVIKL